MKKNSKKLKILHISPLSLWDLGEGKGRISTFYPIKIFAEKGHEVYFLTSNYKQKSGIFDGIKVFKMVNINPIRKRYLDTITTYLSLPFFIIFSLVQGLIIAIKLKPDVIYAHLDYSALSAFIISKFVKSKCILRLYGVSNSKLSFLYKLTQFIAFKLPMDLYILVNDGTSCDKIAEKYKVSSEKVLFWVNGIEKDWSKRPLNLNLKKKLAPNNEKIILSVSRLVTWKQVDILIKAIPYIIKEFTNVKIIIVGDGDQRKYLEKLVKDLNITKFVKFVGAVKHKEIVDYMNLCDIFVSMNALSSISNPVLEAMTCGKVVVALDTGTTKDLIRHLENGILINVKEIDKLANYIIFLLKDDELRRKIGNNAQNFIISKWPTWENRAKFEVKIIESLCLENYSRFLKIKEKADSIMDLRLFNKK